MGKIIGSYYYENINVEADAIDENKHVNNVQYLKWMQDAAMEHTVITKLHLKTITDRYKWFTKRNLVEYEGQCFLNDELVLITWLSEIRNTSATRKYHIYKNKSLIATGESIFIYFDAKELKPTSIPNIVHELMGTTKENPKF
jgi:acyl-CoA thioester hydrolase